MTPRAKRAASVTGAVLFAISVLGFSAGAAAGIFSAGAGVQEVKSSVAEHEKKLEDLSADLKTKADVSDVQASEARIKDAMREAVNDLRTDIRELRSRR